MGTLKKRVIQGVSWRVAVGLGETLLQIGFTAILARLLEIEDFGLVALCLVFIRFARALTDVGLHTAVIQSRSITERQVSAIFCLQVLIRFGVCLLCIAAAPLAARFFDQPQLTALIRVLAWMIVVDSFNFPQVLLMKDLQFKGYSLLQVTSMIGGNLLGVAMAFTGYGVWSLIFRLLAQRLLYSTGIWFVARWVPKKPDFKGIRQPLQFGFTMFGSRLLDFLSQNLASIIIGKFLGVETLGLFNVAYSLAIVPAGKMRSVLNTVLFPAFATLQESPAKFKNQVYASLFSFGAAYIPLMFGLAAVAPNLVFVLFGEKWQGVGFFLTFLAAVGLLKGMEYILTIFLISQGLASIHFKITLIETVAALFLIPIGTYYFDVTGLVLAYVAASFVSFHLRIRAVQASIEDRSVFMRATKVSLAISALMLLAVVAWAKLIFGPPVVMLLTQVFLGFSLYVSARFLFFTVEERLVVRSWPLVGRIMPR